MDLTSRTPDYTLRIVVTDTSNTNLACPSPDKSLANAIPYTKSPSIPYYPGHDGHLVALERLVGPLAFVCTAQSSLRLVEIVFTLVGRFVSPYCLLSQHLFSPSQSSLPAPAHAATSTVLALPERAIYPSGEALLDGRSRVPFG